MVKAVIGVIGALVSIFYCAYLVYYFVDVTGSVEEARPSNARPRYARFHTGNSGDWSSLNFV